MHAADAVLRVHGYHQTPMDLSWLQRASVRPINRAEYQALGENGILQEDERVELIRGFLVRMSPISAEHEWAVGELFDRLREALRGRAVVRMNSAFDLSDDSQPQPDILVFPKGNYRHRLPSKALFLVEIAVTSFSYDRDVKCALYAEEKVPEYWLVDVKKGVVHLYDRPRKGVYSRHRTFRAADDLSPGAFPDIEISVASILP